MGDMLKEFVKSTMENEIKERYPHIRYPAWMYARVTECRKESNSFVVTLQILDKNQQKDVNYPPLPFIRTDLQVVLNDIVVVGMLYGECLPYIVGRCLS